LPLCFRDQLRKKNTLVTGSIEVIEKFEVPPEYLNTIKTFINAACNIAGFNITWQGEGVDEVAINNDTGKSIIKINPKYYRPSEVDVLIGNPEKAKRQLQWKRKVSFTELVKMMVEADLQG
jgi:GDPmannose 4,6-dehydratase